MIEDIGVSENSEDTPIHLKNINYRELCKIVKYLKYHQEDHKDTEIKDFDKQFCDIPRTELFVLTNAANFLSVKTLLDLLCKTIAEMIRGKKVEEIREILNIKNDYTKVEEDKIRKENEWILGSV